MTKYRAYGEHHVWKSGQGCRHLEKRRNWAKTSGAKLYSLATDPEMQAKAIKLVDDGKKAYRVVTSPEAKRAYRQASEIIKKARQK